VAQVGADELSKVQGELRSWLLGHAYDLWWRHGADRARGGFHERLRLDATPTDEPRRARLHPRQMFAYGLASKLGWSGPAADAVEHALAFFLAHYRRGDGLYRTCVAPDGAPLDERALLYDQAFALLGYASGFDALGDERCRTGAHELLDRLHERLAHPSAGFHETTPPAAPLTANSHMHLLEASLEWMALDSDLRWQTLATRLVELALTRLIEPTTGALLEFFDLEWQPQAGENRELVEPGHQFEWAGLLLRFTAASGDARPVPAALRLFDIGERGVDRGRGVAVDRLSLKSGGADGPARLWPQTERLKAGCIAARSTGDSRHERIALESARTLLRYLDAPVRGLWRDRMEPGGAFREEPAPASSFYHIAGAAAELGRLVRA
jgi:mannose-6-phosphate isomerase